MSAPDLTVYHDGSCPLCRLEIDHYRSQPGAEHIAFVDISREGADPGPDLSRSRALGRFHVRLPNGELRSGAAAFVAVWSVLPRWRGLARLARLPGIVPMLEAGYRLVTPLRPTIARLLVRLGLDRGRPAPRASGSRHGGV